jgi:DNA polymerase I-like protein with 3'-5' exonuclease and polymerase domains
VCFQYHDELLLYCKKEYKNQVSDILNLSMKQTNEEIKLNVEIGISVDWGLNYADCH